MASIYSGAALQDQEDARLALAAWPHCAGVVIHTCVGDKRDEEIRRLAESALDYGWGLVNGEPVAPDGWEETYARLTGE